MAFYADDFLASLSDGELADYYFNEVDADPYGHGEAVTDLDAEIARRGLTAGDLNKAWNALAARVTNEPHS